MKRIIIGTKPKQCDYRETCYGIVEMNDKFLIVYSEKDKNYSLVGGGVESGESLCDAIKREFLEESGYDVIQVKEYVNIDCFWIKNDGRRMETDANFLLVKVSQNRNTPLEIFHKPLWVSADMLLSLIKYPYQIEAIKVYFSERAEIDFFNN